MTAKRERIISIIEAQGPADAKSLAALLKQDRAPTQQLLKRMVRAGLLTTLPLAPRTYITTDLTQSC